jgi:hypothetical protein
LFIELKCQTNLQGEQKNRTFAFFGEKFSKFFFQKSPIRGIIFMRFLKIFRQEMQKYGFFWLTLYWSQDKSLYNLFVKQHKE